MQASVRWGQHDVVTAVHLAYRSKGAHTSDVLVTAPPDQTDSETATVDFADVPQPDPSAPVDPFWLQLRGGATLPALYLPPAMAGSHPRWMRMLAIVLISIFMLATVLGICLTYGAPTGKM
jgi:hypothetical protein